MELVILMAVIAVLSGAAISMLSSGQSQAAAEEAARRLAADLDFARADAVANQSARRILFDRLEERYSICVGAVPITHPIMKKPFTVDLASIFRNTGLDLQGTTFSGDTLRFGDDGLPSSGGSVTFAAGGMLWRVVVSGGTGRVTLSG